MLTRGFLLGKFMPPHAGHRLLCDTARALVDQLTILVCWLPDDPVSGPLRLAWMQELYPDCRVVGHGAVVPQAPDEHPDFWPIWREIAHAAHPEPIDYIFASESYGARLATEVGAVFRPVDMDRRAVPLSASMIRSDLQEHWVDLPPPVRGYYATTICLHGVESVGKSSLSAALAQHFSTLYVPEYGRTYCQTFGMALGNDDMLAIALTHDAMTNSQRRHCNRRLILDTDPLMTRVWSLMMLGSADPWFDAWTGVADLYLHLDNDLPWVDDGTRIFGAPEDRARFHALARAELDRRSVTYAVIGGTGHARLANAIAAIQAFEDRRPAPR